VELVEDAVQQAEKAGFRPVRAERARAIIGLKPLAAGSPGARELLLQK
jgi:hypothetical protein